MTNLWSSKLNVSTAFNLEILILNCSVYCYCAEARRAEALLVEYMGKIFKWNYRTWTFSLRKITGFSSFGWIEYKLLSCSWVLQLDLVKQVFTVESINAQLRRGENSNEAGFLPTVVAFHCRKKMAMREDELWIIVIQQSDKYLNWCIEGSI